MNWHGGWNLGRAFGFTQCVVAIAAAVAYFHAKDYRRSLYWTFVACIEATVTW
jgi:hypothetical protein